MKHKVSRLEKKTQQQNVTSFHATLSVFLRQGGNDYEIYCDPRTIGHEVSCPDETQQLCQQIFFS